MFPSVFTVCSFTSLCQTEYVKNFHLKPTNVKLRPHKITKKVKKTLMNRSTDNLVVLNRLNI